jgi:cytochrome c-type protein NapC
MSEQNEAAPAKGLLRRSLAALTRPTARYALGTLLVLGFVGGIVFWGGFNWAMEYQQTVHYQNRTGVRATCPDCHVPKTWVHKLARKIRATNELYHHFAGSIDTREKYEEKRLTMAKSVWRTMQETDSRECRNCHNYDYMDFTIQENRSRDRHADAIDKGETCIDCHKGIAHELPAGAYEVEREISQN